MKKKHFKIGTQQVKPFPVVNVRFRPVDKETAEICGLKECKSLEMFGERPKSLFMAQVCSDKSILSNEYDFTTEERGELLWEKAYREQKAGKEPDPIGYPICAQCTAAVITRFLRDKNEQRAAMAITGSVTTGKDLILFDRNLSRERTYPCIMCATYETLADFRRAYWAHLSQDEEV